MIAIVTMKKYAFDSYVRAHGLTSKQAKQVAVMSHIQGMEFTEVVYVDGSNNVTDTVIKNIKIKE